MRTINEQSKQIMNTLWGLAENNKQEENYYKLNKSKLFMPLTIEIIYKNQISICHYGELNGDLMRDPEMVFFRNNDGDYFPFYFRNDYLGIERFSARVNGDSLEDIIESEQADQAVFADMWLNNIRLQQELNIKEK